ncbi:outer membrane protein assembly factor BamE [Pelomicrobium sp.]|jgi:outer membrane protein assembly factor BamE|uniref:outer membrane protein assembly factor BamE n=1 Tax=Pelomicrobium sp. TaxID=2815319 RepID=UPI002FDD899B
MRRFLPLPLALALAACSGYLGLTPYRMDVQQGNVVTQEMVSRLKPGMTREQVRFILGTPLVADPFHAQRWDYVYRLEKRGRLVEERKLTVIFEEDRLKRVEGDVVAAPPGEAPVTESYHGATAAR